MVARQIPKYQAIYAVLRRRILDGELAAGEQLASQPELAEEFGVTLMTLRQALAALESEGLVWAARGKGTFVADRPVDISVGNLSSFAQQMRAMGVEITTEVVGVEVRDAEEHVAATRALEGAVELCCLTRRRLARGTPIALQRSFFERGLGDLEPGGSLAGESLYDAIEATSGWRVAEARETITAVTLTAADADVLEATTGEPALLSVRTSINQFDQPFLYDEALLVGGRSSITADRTSDRLSVAYVVADQNLEQTAEH